MNRSVALAFFLLLFLVVCCTGPDVRWRQPGASQADMQRDDADCLQAAYNAGVDASLLRRKPVPEAQQKAYVSCMQAKGWRTFSRNATASQAGEPLSRLERNSTGQYVVAFGRAWKGPPGCMAGTAARNGNAQTHLFFGQGGVTAAVTALIPGAGGEPRSYPPPHPLFVYDRPGVEKGAVAVAGGPWSSFCGEVDGRWTWGFGGYCPAGDAGRFAVIVSGPLAAPEEPPGPGLRLSSMQKQAMDYHTEHWRRWFAANCPEQTQSVFWELLPSW